MVSDQMRLRMTCVQFELTLVPSTFFVVSVQGVRCPHILPEHVALVSLPVNSMSLLVVQELDEVHPYIPPLYYHRLLVLEVEVEVVTKTIPVYHVLPCLHWIQEMMLPVRLSSHFPFLSRYV